MFASTRLHVYDFRQPSRSQPRSEPFSRPQTPAFYQTPHGLSGDILIEAYFCPQPDDQVLGSSHGRCMLPFRVNQSASERSQPERIAAGTRTRSCSLQLRRLRSCGELHHRFCSRSFPISRLSSCIPILAVCGVLNALIPFGRGSW